MDKSELQPLLNTACWHGRIFNGDWIVAQGGTHNFIEPASGKLLGQAALANAVDVAVAAHAASRAQPAWAVMAYKQRAEIFRKAATLIEVHGDELCAWIMRETGGIRGKAQVELREARASLHEAAAMLTQSRGQLLASEAEQLSIARRVPHGVVGVISPFNFPLVLSIRAIAPALATGNAVLHKPDLQTPVTGGYLIARLFEQSGLPKGLLHVLPGGAEAGEAMCSDRHIAMISFTGSTQVGRRVGELAGKHLKKVALELGGKNSLIILDDADSDLAAANVAWGAYLHQGQICMAAGRILVQRQISQALIERLVGKAKHLPVGDPMSDQVALGPIINRRQLERIHSLVEDAVNSGATLLAGGTYAGPFYQPTVLTGVAPGMRIFEEETFGPVAAITIFDTDEEAIALASQCEGSLALGVISSSLSRALRIVNQAPAGHVHINDQTVLAEVHAPFGGRGTSGNGSRHGGPADWDEYTQWQWLTIKSEAPHYPF